MDQKLLELKQEALKNIQECSTLTRLNDLRVEYLGKKGFLSGLSSKMGQLQPSERAEFGKKINDVKTAITTSLEDKKKVLEEKELMERLEKERLEKEKQRLEEEKHKLEVEKQKLELEKLEHELHTQEIQDILYQDANTQANLNASNDEEQEENLGPIEGQETFIDEEVEIDN